MSLPRIVNFKKYLILTFLVLMSSTGYSKSIEKVLVLEGQNFNTAIHVGIFDGFVQNGWVPEVVVASCGGAIAAALINAIPGVEERKAFLLSEGFFNLLQSVKYRDPKIFSNLGNLINKTIAMTDRRSNMQKGYRSPPPIFSGYLLEVPNHFNIEPFNQSFNPLGTRIVIIGSKLNFGPQDVGKRVTHEKLYQEVFFTDTETANLLRNAISPVAISFPNSAVSLKTQVITDQSLGVASRVSITDPYLINPAQIGDTYFLGGSIDLYPLEIGYRLGDNVAMVYPGPQDFLGQSALGSSFGFDNNAQLRKVTGMYADHWIDFSNFESLGEHHFSVVGMNVMENKMKFNLPQDFETFKRNIQAQWEFGYARAVEALQQPLNSKHHIRGINRKNTSQRVYNEIIQARDLQ